jgi:hypothetical protein
MSGPTWRTCGKVATVRRSLINRNYGQACVVIETCEEDPEGWGRRGGIHECFFVRGVSGTGRVLYSIKNAQDGVTKNASVFIAAVFFALVILTKRERLKYRVLKVE